MPMLRGLAELVCSNSFRSDAETNAVGLLHVKLRDSQSLIMAADAHQVLAGGALAVDRVGSASRDGKIEAHPILILNVKR